MKTAIIVAAFATVFSFTPAVAAVNLVVNGGFETGNFSGWDQFGDMSSTAVYKQGGTIGGPAYPVADGQYSAAFGPANSLGGITQTIYTVPGKDYYVTYTIANTDITGNNQFIFSFNDGFQIAAPPLGPFDFQSITVPVTATGLTADVSFFFNNPAGVFLLDDVSVTPSVPEPATWSMLLAGFVGIGAVLRRRRLVAA